VFDRHPGLKLVFTEQPGLWWRSELADLDSLALLLRKNNRIATPGFQSPPPDRLPSEYAAAQLFVGASFLARFEAQDASREGYASRVMWGSDYPHPEGVWQYPLTDEDAPLCHLALRDTFTGLPLDDIALMAGENAARVYGLDLGSLRRVAERIGAPSLGDLQAPFDAEDEIVAESYRDGSFAFRRTGAYH
jgi:predicted TIM-barrel fold metal-dependent hydrolase